MKVYITPPQVKSLSSFRHRCFVMDVPSSALQRFVIFSVTLLLGMIGAQAQINHTFVSASASPPVTASGYTASGTATLTLGFAPPVGTRLIVVENTGLPFIQGSFANLAHGDIIALTFGATSYHFVANYYGGNGNDLVLEWATVKPVAWGDNYFGQLGDNSAAFSSAVPVPVVLTGSLAGKTLLSIKSGGSHSIALASDGTVHTWGRNDYGNLGNNSTVASRVPVAVDTSGVLAGEKVVAVDAGWGTCLALTASGKVIVWGEMVPSLVPVHLNTGALATRSAVSIAAGQRHFLALCSDGTLTSWGQNFAYQLGNGSNSGSSLPVIVSRTSVFPASKQIVRIAAGWNHSVVLCSDNTMFAWGRSDYGQLGTGNLNPSSTAVPVDLSGLPPGGTVKSISAGYLSTFAVLSNGSLFGCGDGSYGKMGAVTSSYNATPVQIPATGSLSGRSVHSISAMTGSVIAQCTDGTVVTWGAGYDGQLGDNTTPYFTSVPTSVSNTLLRPGDVFVKAAGGSYSDHGVALIASPAPQPGSTEQLAGIVSGSLYNVAIQPDGKTILAGSFGQVLGVARSNIARLNVDGTLDTSFDPNVTGTGGGVRVTSVVVQPDGMILIGGSFTTIGGTVTRNSTARLFSTGIGAAAVDPVFDPNTSGGINMVTSLALQKDGAVLIAGLFTAMQPDKTGTIVARNGLARVDANGDLEFTPFDPQITGSFVRCVVLDSQQRILVGGSFTSVGSTLVSNLCRLTPAGVLDGFAPEVSGYITNIAEDNAGNYVLAGQFTAINSTPRSGLARVNASGVLDSFDPRFNTNGSVDSVAIQVDGKIIAGGSFVSVQPNGAASPTNRMCVVRFNDTGTLDTSFLSTLQGQVWCVVLQRDGKVLVGGSFLDPLVSSSQQRYARLFNNPASEHLTVPNTSQVVWTRQGAGPEVQDVTFDYSTDSGVTWIPIANATRTPLGWTSTGLTLPSTGMMRARGRPTTGYYSSKGALLEDIIPYTAPTLTPDITVIKQSTGALLTSNSSVVSFGGTVVHTQSYQDIVIRNDGLAALNSISASISPSSHFTLITLPASSLPNNGNTTVFRIQCTPTLPATIHNATLSIVSNDPDVVENPFKIFLTAKGVMPEINVDHPWGTHLVDGTSAVHFGSNVPVCTSVTKTFYVTNLGSSDLHVTGWSAGGAWTTSTSTTATVQNPGSPTAIIVTWSPTRKGPDKMKLHIYSDDGDETDFDIWISGSAVGPEIEVFPNPLSTVPLVNNLGVVSVGTAVPNGTTGTQIRIKNIGNATLHITSTGQTGTFGGPISTSATLLPNQYVDRAVVFYSPGTPGTSTGTFTINSDDCDEPAFKLQLKGTTVATLAPDITAQTASQMVCFGDPVTFSASVTSPNSYTRKWFKGLTLSPTTLITAATTTNYVINAATDVDAANAYMFNASNNLGSENSSPFLLTVVDCAPSVKHALVGTSVVLKANAWTHSSATLSYEWFKGSASLSITTPTLTLSSVTTSHSGLYKCKVTGPGGNMFAGTITLNVSGDAPVISGAPLTLADTIQFDKDYSYFIPLDPTHGFAVTSSNGSAFTITAGAGSAPFNNLPSGLTLDAVTGEIKGRPTQLTTPGTYNFVCKAANSFGVSALAPATIIVEPMPLNTPGKYQAIIERGPINNNLGGRLNITLSPLGTFNGGFVLGAAAQQNILGGTFNCTPGQTDVDGTITVAGKRLSFVIETSLNRFIETASSISSGSSASAIRGWRNIWSLTNPANDYAVGVASLYNVALDSPPNPALPEGIGYLQAVVTRTTGSVAITGSTPLGDAFSTSGFLGPDGDLAVFFVSGPTSVVGIAEILHTPSTPVSDNELDTTSSITFARALTNTTLYQAGFGPITFTTEGGPYTYTAGTNALGESSTISHTLDFFDGGIASFAQNPARMVSLAPSIMSYAGLTQPPNTSLAITSSSGLMTSQFTLLNANPIAPSGVLISTPVVAKGIITPAVGTKIGQGYFLLKQLPSNAGQGPPTFSGAMLLQ